MIQKHATMIFIHSIYTAIFNLKKQHLIYILLACLMNSPCQAQSKDDIDTFKLKAYEGNPQAQFKLGMIYQETNNNPKAAKEAFSWFEKAAKQNHVLAQYNLGHFYLNGIGVEKSKQQALKWWLKSARADHPQSQYNVGSAYYMGIGVDKDLNKARYWLKRGATNNEPQSIQTLKQLGWSSSADEEKYQSKITAIPEDKLADEKTENDRTPAKAQQAQTVVKTPPESKANVIEEKSTAQVALTTPASVKQIKIKLQPVAEAPAANQEPVVKNPKAEKATKAKKSPVTIHAVAAQPARSKSKTNKIKQNKGLEIALFTNPKPRSMLITITKTAYNIDIVKKQANWYQVRLNEGFPVWVHGDFLSVKGDKGIFTGSDINARAVPIITRGSIIGRFNKGEVVTVVNNRDKWYRVLAPARFTAWIKSKDYSALISQLEENALQQ